MLTYVQESINIHHTSSVNHRYKMLYRVPCATAAPWPATCCAPCGACRCCTRASRTPSSHKSRPSRTRVDRGVHSTTAPSTFWSGRSEHHQLDHRVGRVFWPQDLPEKKENSKKDTTCPQVHVWKGPSFNKCHKCGDGRVLNGSIGDGYLLHTSPQDILEGGVTLSFPFQI